MRVPQPCSTRSLHENESIKIPDYDYVYMYVTV